MSTNKNRTTENALHPTFLGALTLVAFAWGFVTFLQTVEFIIRWGWLYLLHLVVPYMVWVCIRSLYRYDTEARTMTVGARLWAALSALVVLYSATVGMSDFQALLQNKPEQAYFVGWFGAGAMILGLTMLDFATHDLRISISRRNQG